MEKWVNKTGRPDAKHIPISATDSRFQHVKVCFHVTHKQPHMSCQYFYEQTLGGRKAGAGEGEFQDCTNDMTHFWMSYCVKQNLN